MKAAGEKRKKRIGNMSAVTGKLIEYTMWVLIFTVILCGAIFGSRYAFDLGYDVFDRSVAQSGRELSITIAEGEDVESVADALEKAGVIDSKTVFLLQSKMYGIKIKPGVYIVREGTSSLALLEQFGEGPGK